MIRAAILGASGYVGGELMRLIAGHPAMEVGVAFGASNAGQPVAAVHPHLALAYPDMAFAALGPGAARGQRPDPRRPAAWRNPTACRRTARARHPVRRPRRRLPARQRRRIRALVRRAACPARAAGQLHLWPARILPRRDRGIEARRRARLLPDRRQPGAEAAGRGRRHRKAGHHRRRRLGRQRRGPRGQCRHPFLRGRRQLSRLWPAPATATPRKWK